MIRSNDFKRLCTALEKLIPTVTGSRLSNNSSLKNKKKNGDWKKKTQTWSDSPRQTYREVKEVDPPKIPTPVEDVKLNLVKQEGDAHNHVKHGGRIHVKISLVISCINSDYIKAGK